MHHWFLRYLFTPRPQQSDQHAERLTPGGLALGVSTYDDVESAARAARVAAPSWPR